MALVVQKYGGSSLASIEQIRAVADRVGRAHRAGDAIVAVVSARGDTTDALLDLAATVSRAASDRWAQTPHRPGSDRRAGPPQTPLVACNLGDGPQPAAPDRRTSAPQAAVPARELDQLLATGECASAALLAIALHGLGVPAVSLTGPQAGVVATGRPGDARVVEVHPDRIAQVLDSGAVAVVAGFQGLNADGDIVTLGRGGSDTAAVAIAAALRTGSCDIRTDVAGVYTADPRLVAGARLQPRLDPAQMVELAFAGARVLHPRAVTMARARGIDLYVGDARSAAPGTVIPAGSCVEPIEVRGGLTAVAHDTEVAHVLVRARHAEVDAAGAIFRVLAQHGVPIDLAASSSPLDAGFRMGFTLRRADLPAVADPLRRAVPGARLTIDDHLATVSLIGTGLLHRPEVAARATSALRAARIPATWTHASQLRLTIVTDPGRAPDAVAVLHTEFGLDRVPA